jgi:hypothetical protein
LQLCPEHVKTIRLTSNRFKMKKLYLVVALLSVLLSCQKETDNLTPEQKQQQQEEKETLLPNEFIEKEGLRFTTNRPVTLQLTPGGLTKDSEGNFSIVESRLAANSEFILSVETTEPLTLDLSVIGFTSMSGSKTFTLQRSLNTGATNILRIKRGIVKYSFFVVN